MVNNETPPNKILSEEQFQWLLVFCCELIFAGFVCSRALTSIGMIAILVLSLFYYGLKQPFKKYFQQKEFLSLSIFFWIVFLSGIYSEDKNGWLNWVRIKLPYLALPLAFTPIKKLSEKQFITVLYCFVITLFISVVAVLGNYCLNYETITDSFLRGNAIPMPFSHIRYTLMLAFSFFICLYLWHKKKYLFNKNENRLQVFLIFFLFIALHILSVRSSLLALYLGILFSILKNIVVEKKILTGVFLLAVLTTAPFLAVKYIPSLHNKFSYMRYDLRQFKNGNFSNLSDGVRVLSMQGAYQIGKQNFILGVGSGDIRNEMENFYNTQYPQLPLTDHKLPHNQLLWVFATTGIVGLLLFLFAFSVPLLLNYKNLLLAVLHLIIFSSFFTEATLEEQMGTGFYLMMLLLILNQQRHE